MAQFAILAFFLSLAIYPAFSQIHSDGSAHCYSCRGDHSDTTGFPDVLPDKLLALRARNVECLTPATGPTFQRSGAPIAPTTNCPLGGHRTGLHKCDVCSSDSTSISDVTSTLVSQFHVVCPKRCNIGTLGQCFHDVEICKSNEFCQVTVDHFHTIRGKCEEQDNLAQCINNKLTHGCKQALDIPHYEPLACTVDCCITNDCLVGHLGGPFSNIPDLTVTTTMATTTTTTTTPAPTTPPSLYGKLEQECRDHLEPGTCDSLKATQDLCKSSGSGLHLDLCPETCGVCQAIKEANCHDTVLEGECAQLIISSDICKDPLAVYTCPRTCNLCDILVEQKLADILAGRLTRLTTTAAPATTTAAATTKQTATPRLTTAPATAKQTTAIDVNTPQA